MKITTEVYIDAPIENLWRAFNDPADIMQWDRSNDWRATCVSNDLRVGGLLKLTLEPLHGGSPVNFTATYVSVDPMQSIEWLADDGHRTRVEFSRIGDRVVVTQIFDAASTSSLEEQHLDWQSVLDNFARHVTAGQ